MRGTVGFMVFVVACLIAGCGGSSSGGSADPITGGEPITRANEANFSADALQLTESLAEANGDISLSASAAHTIDTDLEAIRTRYPDVKAIHTFPSTDLHSLYLVLKPSAPWTANWMAGQSATGNTPLDQVFAEFGTDQIKSGGYITPGDGSKAFTIRFTTPLNLQQLSHQVLSTTDQITTAAPDGFPNLNIGPLHYITLVISPWDGTRTYTFANEIDTVKNGINNEQIASWDFAVSPRNGDVALIDKSIAPRGPHVL